MKNIILTDHIERDHLLPLTFTRPVGAIRIGMLTMAEKWQHITGGTVSFKTQDYLAKVYPIELSSDNTFVNGALIPSVEVVEKIMTLELEQSLMLGGQWLATRSGKNLGDVVLPNTVECPCPVRIISRSWNIFQWNGEALQADFDTITRGRKSAATPAGVTVIGTNLFIEEGAIVRPCIINTETGPVYVGRNSEIMEGALIRGPLALMDHAQIKMGAKIYGPTTIGPHCRVGGEVNNAVMFGYSNKGHDGFIGNTVIGEWCNLGADTNTSNLKNNYAVVKVHNYALNRSESTGGQFCGLTMGDHSKCGINTMFNTGTVCGIFANVFGGDFPHRRIPDFGWGGAAGFKGYRIEEAIETAHNVMERRGVDLTEDWKDVFRYLHETLSGKVA